MAFISSKNKQIASLEFDPIGGLNLSMPGHSIHEKELTEAYNMIYAPNDGALSTRPAFRAEAATPAPGGIQNMTQYLGFLMCSCTDGKLYSFDMASKVFAEVCALQPGTAASMIIFNDKLLIADGGKLRSWDGAALVELAGDLNPTIVEEIGSRVVINSTKTGENDAVYFSKPEDETGWDTSADAIGLRAGYGDGMTVNSFSVIGTDLIVSKVGLSRAIIYRVNTAGEPTAWKVNKLISDTSSGGRFMMVAIPGEIVYLNADSELRSLAGVQEYGDIQIMNAGEKINPGLVELVNDGFNPSNLDYLSSNDMLAIIFNGRAYCYFHAKKTFTYIDSLDMGVRINCACDFEDKPYFGADNGMLYRWDNGSSKDEVTTGVLSDFPSKATSKLFVVPREVVIKRSQFSYNSLAEGSGEILINSTPIKKFGIYATVDMLFDANDDLYWANGDLYSGGANGSVLTIRTVSYTHLTLPTICSV